MRLSIPVMLVSIVFGSLLFSLTPIENISKPSTSMYVSFSAKLILIWASSPAWPYFLSSYLLVSVHSLAMCLGFQPLFQYPLNPLGLPLVLRVPPFIYLYFCSGGLFPPFQLTSTFSADESILVQQSSPFMFLFCMYIFNSEYLTSSDLCTSPTAGNFSCAYSFDPRWLIRPVSSPIGPSYWVMMLVAFLKCSKYSWFVSDLCCLHRNNDT